MKALTQEQQFCIRKQYENEYRPTFEVLYSEAYPEDKCSLIPTGNYSGWVKQRSWDDFRELIIYKQHPQYDAFKERLVTLTNTLLSGMNKQ